MRSILLDFDVDSLDTSILKELTEKEYDISRVTEEDIEFIKPDQTKTILSGNFQSGKVLFIMTKDDWTIIPLENLIAYLHGKGKKVGVQVESSKEVPTYINTLEKGVDALYFRDKETLLGSLQYLIHSSEKILTKKFKVISIENAGSGDRACIDTLTMLNQDEGIFIGSFARNMILVLSENLKNDFIETRPFRVNSGSIHQYVYVGHGKTKYLSELVSGTKIMVFNSDGSGRNSTVGRSKIEYRPMLKVSYSDGEEEGVVFLQNAETVRLMGKDGNSLPINKLKVGDEIIGISLNGARHYGMSIDEKLIEI